MERRYYHITEGELKKLWESRMLAKDIAKHFNVSREMIYAARKFFGLTDRDPVRADEVPDPTPEEIRARKREVRRKHFAAKRAETSECSRIKAWRNV